MKHIGNCCGHQLIWFDSRKEQSDYIYELYNEAINLKHKFMRYQKGFKFKPTFQSEIDYFEFDNLDESTSMVNTIVHSKSGSIFNDCIEQKYYDSAFENGEYVAVK